MKHFLSLAIALVLTLALQGCAVYASPYGYSSGYQGYVPYSYGLGYNHLPPRYYRYPYHLNRGRHRYPGWGSGNYWGGHHGWHGRGGWHGR